MRTTTEFAWQGHEEGAVYGAAAVTYVILGVAFKTAVLNWIVGPLYFVVFVAGATELLARSGRRRATEP